MTTDQFALLAAETRCAHSRLTLDDAVRVGSADDWTAYLRDAAHPCPYAVRDYAAYQTHAPHLPADWLVLRTRAARHGRDYSTAAGALTLPDVARLLATVPAHATGPAWFLYAIHRTGPATPAPAARAYFVEAAHPATGEVRTLPSRTAYHQLHQEATARPTV